MTLLQHKASVKKNKAGTHAVLHFDYQENLINDIKTLPGRQWHAYEKVWTVPLEYAEAARIMIRPFFQLEDEEEDHTEWKTLKMIVTFEQNKRKAHRIGVRIDGEDIFNVNHGNLIAYSSTFDILEQTGGFVSGQAYQSFEVRYEITLKLRKFAVIEAVRGTYEIVEEI